MTQLKEIPAAPGSNHTVLVQPDSRAATDIELTAMATHIGKIAECHHRYLPVGQATTAPEASQTAGSQPKADGRQTEVEVTTTGDDTMTAATPTTQTTQPTATTTTGAKVKSKPAATKKPATLVKGPEHFHSSNAGLTPEQIKAKHKAADAAAAKAVKAKAEKKTAKPVAKPVAKKTLSAAQAKKDTDLPAYTEDTKIEWLVKVNPRRAGSETHRNWDKYFGAKTVGEMFKRGGFHGQLRWDYVHGYLKFSK